MITTQKIFQIHDLDFKSKFSFLFIAFLALLYSFIPRNALFSIFLCFFFHLFFFAHFLILASFSYLFCPHDIMLHYDVSMKSLDLDTAQYDITLDFACLMQQFFLI